MNSSEGLIFRQLFDKESSTYTYLLADSKTKKAVIIDSVKEQLDRDLQLIRELELELTFAIETHIHADHVTGSGLLRQKTGCKIGLSEKAEIPTADLHFKDGDVISFGSQSLKVLATPGHTNTCVTYVTNQENMAFTGDALFVRGCGRTDFQNGSSEELWLSVHNKVFKLPGECLVYPAHDYKGHTVTSVGEESVHNPRLGSAVGATLESFKKLMAGLNLPMPAKLNIAVPANVRSGLPEDSNPVTTS